VYFVVETRYSLDDMSNLVPHVPNPAFWKKYYTDQARGKTYARATPSHRTVGQRGGGVKKGITTVIKTISPIQQMNDRAQSQIKRRLEEVGGVGKKKKIKADTIGKGVSRAKDKGPVKKPSLKRKRICKKRLNWSK
jgi:hypothetical protein